MMDEYGAWSLPGLSTWTERAVSRLERGIALVPADDATPGHMEDAIFHKAGGLVFHDPERMEGKPTQMIAGIFKAEPKLETLLSQRFTGECVIIRFASLPPRFRRGWETFLSRFAERRVGQEDGLHIFVPDLPEDINVAGIEAVASWRTALRRGDRVIWAEKHLPEKRGGATEELAVALATEVCRWRLDLAADLAQATIEDLSAPVAWLDDRARNPDMKRSDGRNTPDRCPLTLMKDGTTDEVDARIWRAQLISLFPLLEDERQRFVDRHRKDLHVDDYSQNLGISSVEELEFGALKWQISRKLGEREADRLAAMTRMRNALAHRKPADPRDIQLLFKHISTRAS